MATVRQNICTYETENASPIIVWSIPFRYIGQSFLFLRHII